MPAITRSQSKMNANTSVTQVSNISDVNYKYTSESKYRNTLEEYNTNTFVKYCENMIRTIKENFSTEDYHNHGPIYFDNIRLITELYYYICESVNSVLIIDGLVGSDLIQNLINIMYFKSIDLLIGIYTKIEMTNEQQHICNCFLQQLKETQQKLYQYVNVIENSKRFPRVCYTEIFEYGDKDSQINDKEYDQDYDPNNEDDIYQLLQDEEDDKKFYEFVEYDDDIML